VLDEQWSMVHVQTEGPGAASRWGAEEQG